MMVDFGSCLHEPPKMRDTSALERRAGDLASPGVFVPVPDGSALRVGGADWVVQSGARDGVSLGSEPGSLLFRARTGERAPFDKPGIIRTELCGAHRYAKGEPIALSGLLRIEAGGTIADADWCSLLQIHQADRRRADGAFVGLSPIFSIGLRRGSDGSPRLVVVGETGRGVPPPGTFSPNRLFAEIPFAFGRDYRVAFEVVDGHGGPGRIRVAIDDAVLVDRAAIAVGYEYVDLLGEAGEPSQAAGSYLKMGVYAGRFSSDTPPSGLRLDVSLREIATAPRP